MAALIDRVVNNHPTATLKLFVPNAAGDGGEWREVGARAKASPGSAVPLDRGTLLWTQAHAGDVVWLRFWDGAASAASHARQQAAWAGDVRIGRMTEGVADRGRRGWEVTLAEDATVLLSPAAAAVPGASGPEAIDQILNEVARLSAVAAELGVGIGILASAARLVGEAY